MVAAGFWRRCAAWSLDAVLVGAPVALLAWPHVRHAVELRSWYTKQSLYAINPPVSSVYAMDSRNAYRMPDAQEARPNVRQVA